jgi:hypothetical protein
MSFSSKSPAVERITSSGTISLYEVKQYEDSTGTEMLEIRVPVSVTESIYESLIMLCAEIIPQYSNSKLSVTSLHPDYKSHLSTLQPIRTLLNISDQLHDLALLKLCYAIVTSQIKADQQDESRDHTFDSLFDIVAMKTDSDADSSVLPILTLAINTIVQTEVKKLSTNDFMFLEKFILILENALRDYHQFDSEIVSLIISFYYRLSMWLYTDDKLLAEQLVAKLKQFQRDSVMKYYKSFYPMALSDEEKQAVEDKQANKRINMDDFFSADAANQSQPGATSSKANGGAKSTIADSSKLKPMRCWSATEWHNFSSGLCEAITIECRQFVPAFNELGFFDNNSADITVYEMIKLFNHDVALCEYDRNRQQKGLDDTGLTMIQALNRVRKHLLGYHALFSAQGKLNILNSFPDLSALCSVHLARWLQNQHSKIQSLRERLIALDSWQSIDQDATPYSDSVNDLHAILSTMIAGFFQHFSLILPYGVQEINKLVELLYSAIIRYSRALLDSCGDSAELIPQENSEQKYKQSLDENDNNSLFSAFKKTKDTLKSRLTLNNNNSNSLSAPSNPNGKKLINQSIRSLCVRLACLAAWKTKISELSAEIQAAWEGIIAEQSQQIEEGKLLGIKISDWQQWIGPENSAILPEKLKTNLLDNVKLGKLEPGALFDSVLVELSRDIGRISDLLAVFIVYCDLRQYIIDELYFPSARAGTKIRSGPVSERVNTLMPTVYKAVQAELFPEIVELLLQRLLNAWRFTLLFGRRIIERDDIGPILRDDYDWFVETFGENMEERKLKAALKSLAALLSTMELATEELIARYDRFDRNLEVSLDWVVRIIGLRSGKSVAKFMKKQREKQKARQAEADKIAKGTLKSKSQANLNEPNSP